MLVRINWYSVVMALFKVILTSFRAGWAGDVALQALRGDHYMAVRDTYVWRTFNTLSFLTALRETCSRSSA